MENVEANDDTVESLQDAEALHYYAVSKMFAAMGRNNLATQKGLNFAQSMNVSLPFSSRLSRMKDQEHGQAQISKIAGNSRIQSYSTILEAFPNRVSSLNTHCNACLVPLIPGQNVNLSKNKGAMICKACGYLDSLKKPDKAQKRILRSTLKRQVIAPQLLSRPTISNKKAKNQTILSSLDQRKAELKRKAKDEKKAKTIMVEEQKKITQGKIKVNQHINPTSSSNHHQDSNKQALRKLLEESRKKQQQQQQQKKSLQSSESTGGLQNFLQTL